MIVLGVIGLAVSYIYLLRKVKISEKTIDRVFFITILAGICTYFGASFFDTLFHCISNATIDGKFNPSLFELDFSVGGITYEGGILTGFVAYLILLPIALPKEKHHTLFYTDQIIPGLLFAHGMGRIGCFLAGCCYGKVTTSFLGINYPTTFGIEKVYPTQLYEAIFLFICSNIFFFFIHKNRTEKYLISYGIFRFLLEFLRGDDRGSLPLGFLSPSQFMSIVMIICGILCIIHRKIIYKKELSATNDETIPVTRYYISNYKGFFKLLFTNNKCNICGNKLKLSSHSTIININPLENENHEYLTLYCKSCQKELDELNNTEHS